LIDEGHGHGTFVASLVLAVAPGARILPVRVLDSDSVGTSSGLAAAIDYAVTHGASVINLSIGMPSEVRVVRQAIQSARQQGVLVVSSAGNTGLGDVQFPAAVSDALSVTSVNDAGVRAPFASYGSAVDLSAPGMDVLGAFPSASGTARWSGTSFSAAIVSGAAALVFARFPGMDGDQVRQRLEDTAVSVDAMNPAFAGRLGRGRVDLAAAVGP
jgi:subtilisin family serine protease